VARTKSSAAEFVPESRSLKALRGAAAACRGCDLWRDATQTVFGEGPKSAAVVMVGEVPGDREDVEGHPFVGPAGKLLDRALADAGIDRDEVYVTNVVKHFKFERRGKRRIHKKPSLSEVAACRPWLEAEIEAIDPDVIVCLGATAAHSVLGPQFRVSKDRGKVVASRLGPRAVATVHPSSILRAPDEEARQAAYRDLVADLKTVAGVLRRVGRSAGAA
jgi:DNA polymerase